MPFVAISSVLCYCLKAMSLSGCLLQQGDCDGHTSNWVTCALSHFITIRLELTRVSVLDSGIRTFQFKTHSLFDEITLLKLWIKNIAKNL